MKIGFFGHSDTYLTNDKLTKLTEIIEEIICTNKNTEFFLGGYGNFDFICAQILKNLKNKYRNFKRIFITPYIENTYLSNKFDKELYDDCIYPPLENIPKKYAILKRNCWIIDNCNFLIFYKNNSCGGTAKAYKYAKQKQIKLININ